MTSTTRFTDAEWEAFCTLIEEGWPGEFDAPARTAWRVLLAPLTPAQCGAALSRLNAEGRTFRPNPGEFIVAAWQDPPAPSPLQALAMIYGGSKSAMYAADPVQRAYELHPYLGGFVKTYGVERLRRLEINDPDWGERNRRVLEDAWSDRKSTRLNSSH